jgi:hypothetical protein
MTDKETPKKAQEPASPYAGEGKVWLIALLGFLVGVLVMYMAMPALFPPETILVEEPSAEAEEGEEFTLDEVKVEEIRQVLADTYFLNSGEEVDVSFIGHEEFPNHVALYYSIMGQETPLFVSKDYLYLYPNAIEFEALEADVAAAKAQYLEMLANPPEEAAPPEMQKKEVPTVQLFLMSNCPYGNQAENGIADVVYLFEGEIEFEPVYILSGSDGSYNSLHGEYELNQGIREKIVYNMYGAKTWMDFVYDVNQNCFAGKTSSEAGSTIDACWKQSAEQAGVDVAAVEAEFEANFTEIADGEVAKTSAAMVTGSPTLIMNGAVYQGARTPEEYKSWICTGFLEVPESCNESLSEEGAGAVGSC